MCLTGGVIDDSVHHVANTRCVVIFLRRIVLKGVGGSGGLHRAVKAASATILSNAYAIL